MSPEIRQAELREKTHQLLAGPLRHIRVAALAAALLPLASVAAAPASAQSSCPGSGSLCAFVWNDANDNGIQDNGEKGIPDVLVTVCNSTGTCLPYYTDLNGSLLLGFQEGATLFVQIPAGSQASPLNVAGNVGISNGAGSSVAPLNPNSVYTNFGLYTPPPSAAVPAPCDFITSGGFVLTPTGKEADFAAQGGCKHDAFWGGLNYVDHGTGYHVNSISITGYLTPSPGSNVRDVCGTAATNGPEGQPVLFRVRLIDNGEPGVADQFGIALSTGYVVSTRTLNNGMGGGGNVQLHDPNPSTTGPDPSPDEATMCMGIAAP
jgi:SdrD B-like domain